MIFDENGVLSQGEGLEQESFDDVQEGSIFEPEDNVEEAGNESDDAPDEAGDETKEGGQLFAGKYKTFGGLAQAYIRQREQLGLPVDLQNYATPEALEKAFLRDKARLEKGGGKVAGKQQDDTDVDLDELDDAELILELQRQQAQIQQALGLQPMMPGQIPGQMPLPGQMPGQTQVPPQQMMPPMDPSGYPQGYPQGYPGQIPQMKHSVFDEGKVSAEEFAEKLMTDPVATLRDVIREELNIQGTQLGYALHGVLSSIMNNVTQVKTQAELDREVRGLERKLLRKGESLEDYWPEMQMVLQQYPGLHNVPNGLEQAYQMAKVQKTLANRTAKRNPAKAGLRMGASRGNGVPRSQYGQVGKLTPQEAERRQIFGDPKKPRGIFDD